MKSLINVQYVLIFEQMISFRRVIAALVLFSRFNNYILQTSRPVIVGFLVDVNESLWLLYYCVFSLTKLFD
jgi:hypothetical protein